jgi:two-component system phosphate regulon response regulator PhoB
VSGEQILVVEDEDDILELLQYNLKKAGYDVRGVTSGEKALKAVRESIPDLLLLDLMLPGLDGIEVCRMLRESPKTADLPIVMLTARGEEQDIVRGLEAGADDYVTKPFSARILLARLAAVLRRKQSPQLSEGDLLRVHDLVIDPGRHKVFHGEEAIDLTSSEFRLLHYLSRKPGWVFTRDQIVIAVHGHDYPVTDRSVDVMVVGLRKKLGDAGDWIETVRGVGYRMKE